jgi:glycosyltransferase involved in cell wall biosynthesis
MRMLVATDQWWPELLGGVARVAGETAGRLAAGGHEVTVLAPVARTLASEPNGNPAVHRVLPRGRLPQTIGDVFGTARGARRIGGDFDLLVAHQVTTAAGLASVFPNVPLALVFHASAVRELRFLRSRLPRGTSRLATYALEPVLVALERRAIKHASAILALSRFSHDILAEDHPSCSQHVRPVSGGVDVDRFSPGDGQAAARNRLGLAGDEPLLLTVRRLESRMGVENLLAAVARIRESVPARLAVAGAGPLLEQLQRLTADLRLGDAVRFLGRVPDDELVDWYRAADVFVLPTVAYEGFGMVTPEALATGTPVVGTPVGATPELLEPLDPRLVAAGTAPDHLAEAVIGVLDRMGPELRQRCRDYACERFAWSAVMADWEAALDGARAPRSTAPAAAPATGSV